MIKYILFLCVMITSFTFKGHAYDTSDVYLKFGIIQPPAREFLPLPLIGVGARFQKEHDGLDLSLNAASFLGFSNYFSLNGLYLYYPRPDLKHRVYFGIGGGVGNYLGFDEDKPITSLTLDGVIGYEYIWTKHAKPYVQFGGSQNLYSTNPYDRSNAPGFSITTGIVF